MSVSEILILKYAVWKRCQKTGSDTPATKMYMISNFLVLTLLSLGFADASIFDLSALRNKGDNDGITIRKTNNTVRPFGASPPTEAAHAPPVSVLIPESAAPQVAVMIPTYTIPYHSIPTPEQSLKRPRIENHIYEQDLEKYIQAEVAFNAFKKAEKRVALRRVIELIASNDLDGFMAYEGEFETAFGHGYHLFKRSVRKAQYMMHYIIRFGATNLTKCRAYKCRPSNEDSNIKGAFEYLIATKPPGIIVQFLNSRRHLHRDSVIATLSAAVSEKHPNLHFLDYIVFEMNCHFFSNILHPFLLNIFHAETEAEKFTRLTELLTCMAKVSVELFTGRDRYLEIPFRYTEYFMNLDIEVRFYVAKLAVVSENTDVLTKIIDLDPDLANLK